MVHHSAGNPRGGLPEHFDSVRDLGNNIATGLRNRQSLRQLELSLESDVQRELRHRIGPGDRYESVSRGYSNGVRSRKSDSDGVRLCGLEHGGQWHGNGIRSIGKRHAGGDECECYVVRPMAGTFDSLVQQPHRP